jgi:hypothetical protein
MAYRRKSKPALMAAWSWRDSGRPDQPYSLVSPTQFFGDHLANSTYLVVSPANLILPFEPFDEGSVTRYTALRFRNGLSAFLSDHSGMIAVVSWRQHSVPI